ncbi:MAG: TIGR03086 family metal-binding protein [Actinomycetota bacterium]|nr:TIGR03086 family metal-binding protein [Actinomycetota bacterium]
MSTEGLEQAFATTRNVLENVKPDQLDEKTPCESWDVRALINHIVGGANWFAVSTNAGESPENDTTEDTDYAGGNFVAAFDEASKKAVAAFGAPGALEKQIKAPFGTFPGIAFLGLATTDTFTHGWDLAKATGQSSDLDPQLAEQLLVGAKASIPEQFRGADGVMPFGKAVEISDSAPAADRLAAFLGRQA